MDDEEINLKIQKLELNDHKKCLAISAKTHKNFDMLMEIIKKSIDDNKRIINKKSGME